MVLGRDQTGEASILDALCLPSCLADPVHWAHFQFIVGMPGWLAVTKCSGSLRSVHNQFGLGFLNSDYTRTLGFFVLGFLSLHPLPTKTHTDTHAYTHMRRHMHARTPRYMLPCLAHISFCSVREQCVHDVGSQGDTDSMNRFPYAP